MNEDFEKLKSGYNLILEHLREGGGESGLCRKLGISRAALRRCRRAHPEFDELWKLGRAELAERVEAALLKRATGYEVDDGKHVPPDVRAAVFWLKNRRPGRWKDGAGDRKTPTVEIRLTAEEKKL